MEDALAVLVSQALDGRTVREGADRCGLAEHLLRDVVYKHSKRPKPDTLQAISAGLGVPYATLALAAYGIVVMPETEGVNDTATDGPHPSDTEVTWTQPDRKRLSAVT